MMSGELTRIEETLRRAYADASAIVPDDDIGPGPTAGRLERPRRGAGRSISRPRWLVPATAGAAVAVIALVAGLVAPNALQHRPPVTLGPLHMGYVVNGAVVPVNLATGTALPPINIGAPGGPAGAVITPDGRTIYEATYRGYVVPVDTVTRTAGHPIRIGGDPQGMVMSPDGNTGYVFEPPYGVAVVDFALNEPAGFIKVHDAWRFALTPDGKTLYVVSVNLPPTSGHGWTVRVIPIDTATLKQLPPVQLPYKAWGTESIAASPDGKTVYVIGADEHATTTSGARGILTPISTATNTALTPIRLPAGLFDGPLSISPDNRTAFVGSGDISAVDLNTGAVNWKASVPDQGIPGVDTRISPDGKTIYALTADRSGDGVLYRISSATGVAQKESVRVVPGKRWVPDSLTVSPDGRTLYAQSYTVQIQPGGTNGPESAALLPVDAATGHSGPFIQLPDPGYLVFGPS
jgi:sugar lactone lactonase YvrE